SLAFFLSKFQVFWSPFQILSYYDIEKNKQGICLAEGRRLYEKELFVRAMQGYCNKRKHSALNRHGIVGGSTF
ncbi:hypothetical protein, partial [Psychrobacter sp. 16-MNA-CIBAN-0192]|uniref:hypothetical protein n=1 Tax=Psychrobacter sp. 16-MNA-CIBAN-0192 TaxID=3140448 RepID=UPI003325F060